jgi:hypothetical protein
MKNPDSISTTAPGAQLSNTCFACKKQLSEGHCFCRLPQKNDGAQILLCSPSCAYRHFAALGNQPNKNH